MGAGPLAGGRFYSEGARPPCLPPLAPELLDVPPVRFSTDGWREFRFLVLPSGTTCLSTSHLRRHSRFSDNDSTTFLFSRSYQDTIIWLVCYYHHSSLLSWTSVVLAIINIIQATLKMFMIIMVVVITMPNLDRFDLPYCCRSTKSNKATVAYSVGVMCY